MMSCVRRNAFRCLLKNCIEEAFLMAGGSLFHKTGALAERDRPPDWVCVLGM